MYIRQSEYQPSNKISKYSVIQFNHISTRQEWLMNENDFIFLLNGWSKILTIISNLKTDVDFWQAELFEKFVMPK